MKSMAFCGEKNRDYKVCLKNVVQYLVQQYIQNKFREAFILCVFVYVNVGHLQV